MAVTDAEDTLPETLDWTAHALFLDFDGTLVPMADHPDLVKLAPETREMLERLLDETSGAVAVISGRALSDLGGHVDPLRLTLSGSHGLETRLAGAEAASPQEHADGLSEVARDLAPLATDHDLLLERKPGAVALNYRLHPAKKEAVVRAIDEQAETHGLRALHGHMVSEVTPRGIDKGVALRKLMEAPPFSGRRPVMIGDDTTDEDAFGAAQDLGGFGVRIGATTSSARYRVETMEEALAWLSATLPE